MNTELKMQVNKMAMGIRTSPPQKKKSKKKNPRINQIMKTSGYNMLIPKLLSLALLRRMWMERAQRTCEQRQVSTATVQIFKSVCLSGDSAHSPFGHTEWGGVFGSQRVATSLCATDSLITNVCLQKAVNSRDASGRFFFF